MADPLKEALGRRDGKTVAKLLKQANASTDLRVKAALALWKDPIQADHVISICPSGQRKSIRNRILSENAKTDWRHIDPAEASYIITKWGAKPPQKVLDAVRKGRHSLTSFFKNMRGGTTTGGFDFSSVFNDD